MSKLRIEVSFEVEKGKLSVPYNNSKNFEMDNHWQQIDLFSEKEKLNRSIS